jgi:hypothetical protein
MKNKPAQSAGLHQWIALGGKPKDYVGAKKNPVPPPKKK